MASGEKVTPSVERSTSNRSSLEELSCQFRAMTPWERSVPLQAGAATRFEGAAGGPAAVMSSVPVPVRLSLSVTVSLHKYLPGESKVWAGFGSDEWGVPSPKSQS